VDLREPGVCVELRREMRYIVIETVSLPKSTPTTHNTYPASLISTGRSRYLAAFHVPHA